jgi:hypothetical protein
MLPYLLLLKNKIILKLEIKLEVIFLSNNSNVYSLLYLVYVRFRESVKPYEW